MPKLTDKDTLATTPDNSDLYMVVDVSDLTSSPQGTSKKITTQTLLSSVIPTAEKAIANGVATLNASGELETSQIPASLLSGTGYQGLWDADTNTPTIVSGVGTTGDFYIVSVPGTTLIDGIASWSAGDRILFNGVAWEKLQPTDAVNSVFGRTGVITAQSGDYTASLITNVPSGGISATTVQGALNELDGDKALATDLATHIADTSNPHATTFVGLTDTPVDYNAKSGLFARVNGTETGIEFSTTPVTSVFGRTGNVVAVAGDYNLDLVNQGTTNKYLSSTEYTDLTDSGESTLHYHASDRARANHTGTQLLSTISDVTSTSAELNLLDGTTVTDGGILFGDGTKIAQDATNLFWDNTSKRLGIGTNSPSYRLEVTRSDTGSGLAKFTSGGSSCNVFLTDAGSTGDNAGISSNGDNIRLLAGGSSKVTVLSNGNVGIATTTPTRKFHLRDAVSAGGELVVQGKQDGNIGNYAKIWLSTAFSTNIDDALQVGRQSAILAEAEVAWGVNNSIHFMTSDDETVAPVKRMTVRYNGNVGIGTTAPDARLHVSQTTQPTATNLTTKLNDIGIVAGKTSFTNLTNVDQLILTNANIALGAMMEFSIKNIDSDVCTFAISTGTDFGVTRKSGSYAASGVTVTKISETQYNISGLGTTDTRTYILTFLNGILKLRASALATGTTTIGYFIKVFE